MDKVRQKQAQVQRQSQIQKHLTKHRKSQLGTQPISLTGYNCCRLLRDDRIEIFWATSQYLNGNEWYDWCIVGFQVGSAKRICYHPCHTRQGRTYQSLQFRAPRFDDLTDILVMLFETIMHQFNDNHGLFSQNQSKKVFSLKIRLYVFGQNC